MEFQQPSTNYTPALGRNALPTDPGYQQNLVDRYASATQPAYNASRRNLNSDLLSQRGLSDSGIAAGGLMGLQQGRTADVNAYAGQVGQHQADINQENLVRQQGYAQQAAMLAKQQAFEADQANQAHNWGIQQANNNQWGDILKGAGNIVGSFYGDPGAGSQIAGVAGAMGKMGGQDQQPQQPPAFDESSAGVDQMFQNLPPPPPQGY